MNKFKLLDDGLIINKISKTYSNKKVVRDISLSIQRGEIVGLLGPNGAGKTTTLRSMLNLISSDSGKTNILGKDVNELSSKEISHISYLPGEFEMYSNLTGKQYLTYISNLRNAKTNNIHLLSDQLDLDLNKKINALSKGNKQKIGIVQAFMNSPKLAILDEPTSGLDPLKQQEFQNIVKEQNKKGCSVLLSSHILNEIEDLCEKVGIIKDGTLIASEQISALKNKTIKKYEVTFENPPSENKLSEIKGIYDLKIKDEIATFTIKGNIDDMIKTISKFTVINLRILEPDLEEIFLTYYHKA